MAASTSKRMTQGPIASQLIRFAIPIFFGNLFQQLYNVVDALIVGRLLGNTALASVTSTGSLVMMLIGFFSGIGMGAGVVISRYFGAKDTPNLQKAVHTALAFGAISGLLITVLGYVCSPELLVWMDTPAEVMDQAVAYIRVYFLGALGVVLYNTCVGIMRSVGDSRHPLEYLIISSCLNVVLDLVFIGVFHWGVAGAAFATILAQFISVILCLARLMRVNDVYRVQLNQIAFDPEMLKLIIRYGLPSGIQFSIISFANVVVQTNVNAFGEMAMAGCGAYSKLEGFAFLPIDSFCMAITTFVGQNLGAREYDRARRGARMGVLCSMATAEFVGVLFISFAPVLIGAFTSEPEAIAFGVSRARICASFYFLLAYSHSTSSVLRGAGRSFVPMLVMVVLWCAVRVSILVVFVPIFQAIDVVSWVYPITWSLSGIVLLIYYLKADWIRGFEDKRQNMQEC